MELTKAQVRVMKRMRGYRVVATLENGAILVARVGKNPKPKILDTNGREFSFRRHLTDKGRS